MKRYSIILALVLLAACGTSKKSVWAEGIDQTGAAITVEIQGEKASLNGVKTYSSVTADAPALPPGWTANDAAIARLAMEKARCEAENAAAELALAKLRAAEDETAAGD